MYIVYGLLAALFASLSTITIKKSLVNYSSILITFYKTVVIFILSLLLVDTIEITFKNLIIILLTGVTTTLAWIYYFKTIKETSIKNVVAIDKLSTVVTMILAFFILGESLNIISIILISTGIFLMLNIKEIGYLKNGMISVLFLSITAILSKLGLNNTSPMAVTFIRNSSILMLITIIAFKEIRVPDKVTARYVGASAILTMASWISFYKGIKLANVSLVMPLEKLNILFTILISKEKLERKEVSGLILIVIGTIYLLF